MSTHITCDVDPSLHRFDLAVLSVSGPTSVNPLALVVYERCALSEIVIERSIRKVIPSDILFRGATFPRYGKHFSPRRWLASLDPETDVLVLTGAKSFERVPADRVVVLAHHMPGA